MTNTTDPASNVSPAAQQEVPIEALAHTPLYELHRRQGGKMVPFAGYALPVHYPLGILKEHLHTREKAGLFDVSHMGQAYIHGRGDFDPALALERLMPGLLTSLKGGKMRYSLLLNEEGGIEDDLIVTRLHDSNSLYLVVNAARKEADFSAIIAACGDVVTLEPLEDRALLALQGPQAEKVLTRLAPEVAELSFMEGTQVMLEGAVAWVSRSGYTGEDGFEISIPEAKAVSFAERLLGFEEVALIGLGARDSLRLEAGLCLSGHDFNGRISPVEASLEFALSRKRLKKGDFQGAGRIARELSEGTAQVRVGIKLDGRAPAREGALIVDENGAEIGRVTSGGFAPSLDGPIAMGFVPPSHRIIGSQLTLMIRGKAYPATVAALPFIQPRYKRMPVEL